MFQIFSSQPVNGKIEPTGKTKRQKNEREELFFSFRKLSEHLKENETNL